MVSFISELNSNHKEVLNLIRLNKELSGAEIARITNLQPSTVVYILKTLSENNLIIFSKTGVSTNKGGKKPTLYKINPDVGIIIGLEILLQKIKLSVIDFAGNRVLMHEEEYEKGLKGEVIAETIINVITQFSKRPGFEKGKILGLGIAVSGMVNSSSGLIYFSRKLQLENFNLKEAIEKKLSIKTYVVNDANAGMLGYRWFSQTGTVPVRHAVYLIYNQDSSHIGAGILINGQLYEGASGAAGEIISNTSSLKTLIDEANLHCIESDLIKPNEKLSDQLSIDDVIGKVKKKNPVAIDVIESLCNKIAAQIVSVTTFINPQAIIIGGDIADYGDFIIKRIIDKVNEKISDYLKRGFEMPKITTSQHGTFSASIGATAMLLNDIFTEQSK